MPRCSRGERRGRAAIGGAVQEAHPRGTRSFRPATKLILDLLDRARDQFLEEPGVREGKPVVLAEMTLPSLRGQADVGHTDFLASADILGVLGLDVLISRFEPYYQLAEHLAGYTDGLIGLAVGFPAVRQVADEKYYTAHGPRGRGGDDQGQEPVRHLNLLAMVSSAAYAAHWRARHGNR
jgi:hypothetical protein